MENDQITADDIRAEIKRLVAEITEREPEEISDTASFAEELGIDSLMAIEMMIAFDKKFKIDIPEQDFNKVKTVKDAVDVVQLFLPRVHSSAGV